MSAIITISFLIKAISLAMILYSFRVFSNEDESDLSLLTKYFLIKQRYRLLRMSLLFIAAIIMVELASMAFLVAQPISPAQEFQLIASDIVFLFIIAMLSMMYRYQQSKAKKLDI